MSRTATARTASRPDLSRDAIFLVWGPPSHGPRSRVFAGELGIECRFVGSFARRGAATAPLRYAIQAVRTAWLLARRRPRLIFVQSPPTLAPLLVAGYAAVTGARFVVDAHSAAMLSPVWTRPRWLVRLLARRASATIVTNESLAGIVAGWGGRALVIPDVPTTLPVGDPYPVEGGFNVMVVSTFAPDEPLDAIVDAARGLPRVRFYVTGDPSRAGRRPHDLPPNVRFTGFLPDAAYRGLMTSCDAVACLTTRDHTMQRGACEALWSGRPILTSDTRLLRTYFDEGTVHVAPTAEAIHEGVLEIERNHARYAEGIERLAARRRSGWQETLGSLLASVSGDPVS